MNERERNNTPTSSMVEEVGRSNSLAKCLPKNRPTLNLWSAPTFEELTKAWVGHKGSHYERKHGLKPRCVYGKLHNEDVGTITYYTDDGRIGLIWALRRGKEWLAIYPTDKQFNYFYKACPSHIAAVLTNNKKEYKL